MSWLWAARKARNGGSAFSTPASPARWPPWHWKTARRSDGEAIGTSGDYQRFFEVDGKRYAHLLDPRSGYPADHTQAVTVLIPAGPKAGTLSDASSKPIFIAGAAGWRDMAAQMGIAQVLRVDSNDRIFATAALHRRLEFIGQPPAIEITP